MTEILLKMKNSIVLVPFPFDDFSTLKVRPALCLTNEIGNYNHIIIAFISSKINDELLESDLIIKLKEDLKSGLQVDSVIKLHKLVTIPKILIKRKLGIISDLNIEIIENKLSKLFSLNKTNL